jgi:hypothetical protein
MPRSSLLGQCRQRCAQSRPELDSTEALAFVRDRTRAGTGSLAVDPDEAPVELEVSPAHGHPLRNPSPRADQEVGKRAVVLGASVQVVVDLV